jgi:hypothetical protein
LRKTVKGKRHVEHHYQKDGRRHRMLL